MYQNMNNNYPYNGYGNQPQKDDSFAVASFVSGILAFFLDGLLLGVPSIVGVVLGIISRKKKSNIIKKKDTDLAIVGIILSIVALVLWIIGVTVFVIAFKIAWFNFVEYLKTWRGLS